VSFAAAPKVPKSMWTSVISELYPEQPGGVQGGTPPTLKRRPNLDGKSLKLA